MLLESCIYLCTDQKEHFFVHGNLPVLRLKCMILKFKEINGKSSNMDLCPTYSDATLKLDVLQKMKDKRREESFAKDIEKTHRRLDRQLSRILREITLEEKLIQKNLMDVQRHTPSLVKFENSYIGLHQHKKSSYQKQHSTLRGTSLEAHTSYNQRSHGSSGNTQCSGLVKPKTQHQGSTQRQYYLQYVCKKSTCAHCGHKAHQRVGYLRKDPEEESKVHPLLEVKSSKNLMSSSDRKIRKAAALCDLLLDHRVVNPLGLSRKSCEKHRHSTAE